MASLAGRSLDFRFIRTRFKGREHATPYCHEGGDVQLAQMARGPGIRALRRPMGMAHSVSAPFPAGDDFGLAAPIVAKHALLALPALFGGCRIGILFYARGGISRRAFRVVPAPGSHGCPPGNERRAARIAPVSVLCLDDRSDDTYGRGLKASLVEPGRSIKAHAAPIMDPVRPIFHETCP